MGILRVLCQNILHCILSSRLGAGRFRWSPGSFDLLTVLQCLYLAQWLRAAFYLRYSAHSLPGH